MGGAVNAPRERARRLLRLYPRSWRDRYGEEFCAVVERQIEELPRSPARTFDVAGTVADDLFDLKIEFVATKDMYGGDVTGEVAGESVKASWRSGNNNVYYPVVPASLSGSLGKLAASLKGKFLLKDYMLDSGTIAGSSGDRDVEVFVYGAPGQTSSSAAAFGSFGGTSLELYATHNSDETSGWLGGIVNGAPVILVATANNATPQGFNITGTYHGPPAVLAIMTMAWIYSLAP
jgi:hypothetical protein